MIDSVTHAIDTASLRSPIRLLVVDDDDVDRQTYLRFLRGDAHNCYVITEATTAERAAALLSEGPYDCILLDYRLPGADGMTLYQTFLSAANGEKIAPAIMMTGQGNEAIAVEALKCGIADYLTKDGLTAKALQRAINNAVDRSRLRLSLNEKNRHLAQANAELNRQASELQRLYHSVSHELKTPLTAVREFIALVLDGVVGALPSLEQTEFLEHALDGCDQMTQHLNDLIDSARLDIGKLKLKLEPVRVNWTVDFAMASIRSIANAKNLTLEQQLMPGLPAVHADPMRLTQILGNLLNNAAKFTEPGGRITLAARIPNGSDQVEFSVTDSGCGISPEHMLQVFDRLFQVTSAGDELMGSGLGLGLSIAQQMVTLHGGRLHVESEIGRGSTFSFALPIAVDVAQTGDVAQTVDVARTGGVARAGGVGQSPSRLPRMPPTAAAPAILPRPPPPSEAPPGR